jgi:carboxymethylenebutenolidase
MGEMITFDRPDGGTCAGYLATPAAGPGTPAMVVIQEWWGLNPQIRGIADRLAAAGYTSLVPDLYRGKLATSSDEASHMMSNLNFLDAADQDVRGAVRRLKVASPKVAVGGFCMGGALTIISAVRVPEMDAGVCFYGIPPKAVADPAELTKPMLFHFATQDDWCTPTAVADLETSLGRSNAEWELHRYEAQHAFMNEARPEVYDASAAKLAWERTLGFLKKQIG